ncbi:hypothetical protein Pcinc_027473, partial [Petrolisthes cinctipes]
EENNVQEEKKEEKEQYEKMVTE